MKRVDFGESFTTGASKSSVDSNRLYSILLDARASAASETMFDIAEKLLLTEKENSKNALERLWSLKKNLQGRDTSTVDLLIQYYQGKLDVLRSKEEYLKKISKDSRSLLEDKRKKDIEIAAVKQELEDCSRELDKLQQKQDQAKTKEQELVLIEMQLRKELDGNENEIVNGLYEIILSPHDGLGGVDEDAAEEVAEQQTAQFNQDARPRDGEKVEQKTVEVADQEPEGEAEGPAATIENAQRVEQVVQEEEPRIEAAEALDESEEEEPTEVTADDFHALYKQIEVPESDAFPKSVVKTTGGVVIGEYFYDSKVYKNKRSYVCHSLFLCEQLMLKVQALKREFDRGMYAEALQMLQDAHKRVSGNAHLYFEVSTNEIVNETTLKVVWQYLKDRKYDDVLRFSRRLKAKIKALGSNYRVMLKEQIQRCSQP